MLQLMCASGSIKALKFPDLRWILTGGAAPDPALVHRVATLFDCDLIQGFGMTEATCHVAFKVETRAPMKEGLRVLPGLDLKVVGPDDETVGPRQVREIVIKGETVFSGYLADGKLEAGSKEVFTRDGYYRSGDLGSLDEAGHVHIVGRRKDMINVGGENVFAWEIEQVIDRMDGVKECAAFAMPDDVLGEVVEVAIVRTGAQPTAARVKERCRKLLANFKVPHRVHFLDQLPRAPTGKVQKHLIAERIRATLAAETLPPSTVQSSASPAIAQAVAEVVTTHMATLTSERIDQDRPLFDAGLDSLGTLELIELLEQRFSLQVPPTLLYDHPTIRELAAYFALQDAPAPMASAAASPRATAKPASPSASSRPRRSALSPSALPRRWLGIAGGPGAEYRPLLVLFDLSAGRLTTYQLLPTGPSGPRWCPDHHGGCLHLACDRTGQGPGVRAVSPGTFAGLLLSINCCSLEGTRGLRGTAILNAF
jgi:acyl carrier protein